MEVIMTKKIVFPVIWGIVPFRCLSENLSHFHSSAGNAH